MAGYGYITDVDTVKQDLRDLNRNYENRLTWSGAENALAVNAQAANESLMRNYSNAMSEAYNAMQANQRTIDTSGVTGQQRNLLSQQNRIAMQEAYNSYLSGLQSGQQSIVENYAEGMQDIDTALTEQAQNMIDYKTAHEDYLQYLWYEYQMGNNTLFDSAQWSKFLVDEIDEETGEALLDEEGNVIKRLKTMDELYNVGAYVEKVDEEGKKYKEWQGMYDDEGRLTLAGIDFFDQLENQNLTGTTFGKFIAQTDVDYLMGQYGYTRTEAEKVAERNAELFKWSQSYNLYNYTEQGTNKGSFRQMVNLESTDDTYSFAERFGGMTSDQINGLFKDYQTALTNISEKMSKAKDVGKEITGDVKDLVESVHQLTIDLGIDKDVDIDWAQLERDAFKYYTGTKSSGEMAADWFGTMSAYTGASFLTGGAIGGTITAASGGAMAPVAAVVAAVIGISGAIAGTAAASEQTDEQRTRNKEMAENAQKLFNDALIELTSYANAKKRQLDIDFMTRNG